MTNCNNVIFSYVSYRRNIKDMLFVNKLNDQELAIGVSRSASEIYGDEIEFKALKNLPLNECLKLEEKGVITKHSIENKDISAFGLSEDNSRIVLINEQDHIRLIAKKNGFCLEDCFNIANEMDDLLLEKLEVCFDINLGYLTANPKLIGTGLQIGCMLFLPALWHSKKLLKIKNDVVGSVFELYSPNDELWKGDSPFIKIQNVYTFGYKENEFAQKLQSAVQKLIELEIIEENNIFNLSASTLVDNIFRAYGILYGCYRISHKEAETLLGQVLWGINLKMLKLKKYFNVFEFLLSIKDHHLTIKNDNIKELEKKRAKLICKKMEEFVFKGEVDV